jgi:dinuclear metal center YbgI/SA1388 family protein
MQAEKMKVKAIAEKIEKIVPLRAALDWDNVGLLVGDAGQNVKNVLITIDITKGVLAEAKSSKTDLIVSYHPVIWNGLKTVTSGGEGDIVYELVRSGISVYSVHTALDVIEGGVNDELAKIVGIADAEPIGDFVPDPAGGDYKLVVFVPTASVAKVSNAIFAAGAGNIGNYSHCGFEGKGTGSFLPLKGAKPAIGKRGKLEKVQEVRFETIVPAKKLEEVIAAMKKAHPYEEPAYDCFRLYSGENKFGLGRIGKLNKPAELGWIIGKIKKCTGAKAIGIIGREKRIVAKAAVCAGSCGKIINSVIAAKADLYVTGELKHHQALAAQEAGVTCVCLSHSVSERFVLKKFASQLRKEAGEVTVKISKKDADPFRWKEL